MKLFKLVNKIVAITTCAFAVMLVGLSVPYLKDKNAGSDTFYLQISMRTTFAILILSSGLFACSNIGPITAPS